MGDCLVSVVLLNWNGAPYVFRCVEAVTSQTYRPIELIVVDNGSQDGSVEEIERRGIASQVIRNPSNVGFAAGMNQGIEASHGEFVLLLNSDVVLHDEFVQRAVAAMEADVSVGMVAPRVFRWAGDRLTEEVDSTGLMMRWSYRFTQVSADSPPRYVFGPCGACPFLRRKMLRDVRETSGHYFDESYFAFGEDMDLWFRAQLQGWKCYYDPRAIAWHIHSASLGGRVRMVEKPRAYQLHALRNRYVTVLKNCPSGLLMAQALPLLAAELVRTAYFAVAAPRTAALVFQALRQLAARMPEVLESRRRIQAGRRVGSLYLLRFFVKP